MYHENIPIWKVQRASEAASQSVVYPENQRVKIMVHALLFVAGFSLVFIVGWGGSVTTLGQLFGTNKSQ